MDDFRQVVERHFRVYETRQERLPGGTAHLYFLMFPAEELESRFDKARQELMAVDRDLIVFLRHEGGEDILVVAPRPPVLDKSNRLNWILLAATLVTTILAGAMNWYGYRHVDAGWSWAAVFSAPNLAWGFVWYALPLMVILGIHETAHFLAAKRHGLRASLPYFIPFPPVFLPIGTLGAFIRLKDPLPDRKALFDVGASGPLAGFIVAIPVILLGAMLTNQAALEVPDRDRPVIELEAAHTLDAAETGRLTVTFTNATAGTHLVTVRNTADASWDYTLRGRVEVAGQDDPIEQSETASLAAGDARLHTFTLPANTTSARVIVEWEDGLVRFGDSLLVWSFGKLGMGEGDYLTHPLYFAGWIGLFVTGLNLIPASQLDGGHVARAILGDRMRYAAYAAVFVLFYLAFQFTTWLLLAVLIWFMGVRHPPPLNDRVKLDPKRKVLAAIVVLVLVTTFIPQPFIF